jgi:hypothetical protein
MAELGRRSGSRKTSEEMRELQAKRKKAVEAVMEEVEKSEQ